MGSLLKSTQNTRAILKDSFRFVRSDVPNCITDQDAQWLIAPHERYMREFLDWLRKEYEII